MSEILTELTPENEALMHATADEWLDRCLGGNDEINTTQEMINWLYQLAGLKEVPMLVVDSPRAATFAADALVTLWNLSEGRSVKVNSGYSEEDTAIRNQALEAIWSQLRGYELFNVKDAKQKVEMFSNLDDPLVRGSRYIGMAEDCGWVSFYEFFEKINIVKHDNFKKYREFIQSGVWGTVLFDTHAIVYRRPNMVKRDEQFDLHCTTGPAISWRDGFEGYYVHGINVEKRWILDPQSITPEEILGQQNVEVRRTMVDLLGYAEFCRRAKFKVIDTDIDGGGQKRELLHMPQKDDVDIVIIHVKCPSTRNEYHLRVPANIKTCAQAVAWTYTKEESDYAPLVEA